MEMDRHLVEFPELIDNSKIDGKTNFPNFDHNPYHPNDFEINDASLGLSYSDNPSLSPDVGLLNHIQLDSCNLVEKSVFSLTDASHGSKSSDPTTSLHTGSVQEGASPVLSDEILSSSDPVLRYISQMLMEDNMEEESWIMHEQFALENTKKSLYDALKKDNPVSPDQQFGIRQFIDSLESSISGSSSDHGTSDGSVNSTVSSNSTNPYWTHDPGQLNHVLLQDPYPSVQIPRTNTNYSGSAFQVNSMSNVTNYGGGLMDTSANKIMARNMFDENNSILQFMKGMEEARKFLLKSSQLIIDIGDGKFASERNKNSGLFFPNGSRARKAHEREDDDDFEDGRANKQTALSNEEVELSEMFDKVLLWNETSRPCEPCWGDPARQEVSTKDSQLNGQARSHGDGGKGYRKKRGTKNFLDLRNLLILCAQAISSNDLMTANEHLKQVQEHSSPTGDGSQRLAHYFANGLEARLAGSGSSIQTFEHSAATKRMTAANMLKAYQLHLLAFPFKIFSISFANLTILNHAANAKVLHIIDFGIGHGFQWPLLIQKLSAREGGPPILRITGIEIPVSGFRPTERIEETGCRLHRYCKHFNVPFEYNYIASKDWKTIRIEELKTQREEVVAVNCLFRFNSLYSETSDADSPRDAMLSLIRKIKPDVFVHAITNGSYNSPFFVTRFREALFHLSAIYDMFDVTISADNKERLILEREFYGREVINVVACEGKERVCRPETYKTWQARHMKAGFKQCCLDQEIMKKFRVKLGTWYHKDYALDENNNWMLLGWRGRIMYASSCWVPV